MTGIWALLPADHAAAVWAAVNTHAEASRMTGDDRTADQRRADSLTDLMTAYLTGTCPAEIAGGYTGTDTRPETSSSPACRGPGEHRAPKVPFWCRVQIKISPTGCSGTALNPRS